MVLPHEPVSVEWQAGDYAMRGGYAVRLQAAESPGRFTLEFVADYRGGAGITCGGYASSYSAEDLEPITDVEMLILVRAYEAARLIRAAKDEIAKQEKVFAAHEAALRAYQTASAALAKAKASEEGGA